MIKKDQTWHSHEKKQQHENLDSFTENCNEPNVIFPKELSCVVDVLNDYSQNHRNPPAYGL